MLQLPPNLRSFNMRYSEFGSFYVMNHESRQRANNRNEGMFRDQLLTRGDLDTFKNELITELKALLTTRQQPKPWLKSNEVRKVLTISAGTLQNLRVNGSLPFTKIGGIIYYKQEDINRLLEPKDHSG